MNQIIPSHSRKFYIIAGEPSGDFIGAQLIKSLKEVYPDASIQGIGGPLMQKEGLNSLFDIKHISIMGFAEIIPSIFRVLKLIKLTVSNIKSFQPDMLITIDSPGFNLKVAKLVKQSKLPIKLLHYVAPSVWAYKPKRIFKFKKVFDYLLCLLPFEPPLFNKIGLKSYFVGHPIIESKIAQIVSESKQIFPKNNLLLLPGSRRSEVKKLLPIFLQVSDCLQKTENFNKTVVVTVPYLYSLVKELCIAHSVEIITDIDDKYQAMLKAKLALAASGTVTSELAIAKTKTIVAYKMNFISSFLVRLMIKVKYVTLINILSNKAIFPEYLAKNCTVDKILTGSQSLLSRELQYKLIYKALAQLGYHRFIPSKRAAKIIKEILSNSIT